MKSIIDYTNKLKSFFAEKQALSDEVETRATLGAHNLAVGEFSVYSSYGVTFTPQADRSVIAYSANAPSDAVACSSSVFTLKAGSYVLGKNLGERENVQLLKASDNSSIAFANLGNDVPFTLNADTEVKIVLYAYSAHGAYNNVVYKPFIRLASDAITEWSSPVPTNAQLLSYKDNGVLGAHNLLKNYASSAVEAGVNCNVTSDGRVICTRVSSSSSDCLFAVALHTSYTLPKGSYHLSGCPTNVSGNPYGIQLYKYVSGNLTFVGVDLGSGLDFTLSEDSGLLVRISISSSYNAQNLEFKPMIRLASDTDTTYQPYAKTNQELTNDVKITTSGAFTRIGNIVFYNKASWSETIPSSIPSGFRPKSLFVTLAEGRLNSASENIQAIRVVFNTNGTITLGNSMDNFLGSFTYIGE